ncbi:MAG: excinuclease ABC subunit UvrC [Candidatus Kerfeldbacteria bacterium]|nr:excinuclease ABC subunit UvrC [Candidatus Kerfeldbacteria bacterium]
MIDLRDLPQAPGVYRFYDKNDRLLYIGKATSLRSRVSSYFRSSTALTLAKQQMVQQIVRFEYTVVTSSHEALLLETTLIKKHQPPYNIIMKDDKNYQYIHMTSDAFPRLETIRKLPETKSKRTGQYFGPYTSGLSVKRTLRLLKRIFRYCDTPPQEKNGELVLPKRPCLEYHTGRCSGACAGEVSATSYQKTMREIRHFFAGDYKPIAERLEHEMKEAAAHEQFERAARLRDQWQSIFQLMKEQHVVLPRRESADVFSLARLDSDAAVNVFLVRNGVLVHQQIFRVRNTLERTEQEILDAVHEQYMIAHPEPPKKVYLSYESRRGAYRKLLDMGARNAEEFLRAQLRLNTDRDARGRMRVQALSKVLGIHPDRLRRIEVYDISHHQGAFTVASMVVGINGMPKNSEYRHFTIKTVMKVDDFASMQEVMDRRLRHLKEYGAEGKNEWDRPDLIVIDGGKGQLSAAHEVFCIRKCDIPMISLAKREEEIFRVDNPEPIVLPRHSEALHYLQEMRDEAHRFAITFYRKKHTSAMRDA